MRTGLDHSLGVVTARGVDGLAVDVEEGLGQHLGGAVNHVARAVELPVTRRTGHQPTWSGEQSQRL